MPAVTGNLYGAGFMGNLCQRSAGNIGTSAGSLLSCRKRLHFIKEIMERLYTLADFSDDIRDMRIN
ncbi:hypothetical protein BRYFOR_07710 [Marvinbryantia formatexigens DSM 14469]|uniref:Uncharacterized protein n=2 Tax=Marvinbryantia TaxID=248744 RepID=C6LGF0_9FIRM|nr:hypothetical protein BRYFOR_07710 [Marvinbryantia formatexigens DSM 14469]